MKYDINKPLWKQKLKSEFERILVPDRMRNGSIVMMRDGKTKYRKYKDGSLHRVDREYA